MYSVIFTNRAVRDLEHIEKTNKKRIIDKLKEYSNNPLDYAIKLSNHKIGSYRFRVGDFRIIFDLSYDEIIILRIGHRKNIY